MAPARSCLHTGGRVIIKSAKTARAGETMLTTIERPESPRGQLPITHLRVGPAAGRGPSRLVIPFAIQLASGRFIRAGLDAAGPSRAGTGPVSGSLAGQCWRAGVPAEGRRN